MRHTRAAGRRGGVVAVALAAALAGAGCATTPAGPPPLCSAPAAVEPHQLAQQPERWFRLLLHGWAPTEAYAAGQVLDCTGAPVTTAVEPGVCGSDPGAAALRPLPARALGREDLVLEQVDADTWLAWVQVRRLPNGEAVGPAAVVDLHRGQLQVRTLGALRALATRPRLRLEAVAGTRLLVAEGEACPEGGAGPCERSAQLLPVRGRRFFAEPLTDAAGACVGPGRVHVARVQAARLPSGWVRQAALSTRLSFEAQRIVAEEQLVVDDRDPQQPTQPPRVFRRAQAERVIRVEKDRLVVDQPSLGFVAP